MHQHPAHLQMLPQQQTLGQKFRERVSFVLLVIVGVYFGTKMLIDFKSILEPFLWSVVLVMSWEPAVTFLEEKILVFLITEMLSHSKG